MQGRLSIGEPVPDLVPLECVNEAFDLSRRATPLRPVLAVADDGRLERTMTSDAAPAYRRLHIVFDVLHACSGLAGSAS